METVSVVMPETAYGFQWARSKVTVRLTGLNRVETLKNFFSLTETYIFKMALRIFFLSIFRGNVLHMVGFSCMIIPYVESCVLVLHC